MEKMGFSALPISASCYEIGSIAQAQAQAQALDTGAYQCQGSRARAAPQRGLRPPARSAQRCESGGKARSASGGCHCYTCMFMMSV